MRQTLRCYSCSTALSMRNTCNLQYFGLLNKVSSRKHFSQQLSPAVPASTQQRRTAQQKQQVTNTSPINTPHKRLTVRANALGGESAAAAAGVLWEKMLVLLSGLSAVPWLALGAVAVAGMLVGLSLSKAVASYVQREMDPHRTSRENAELRAKVEDLQQLLMKLEPLAYKCMRLRFTKGINKAVILGMVDSMLANKEVNIWWLPDQLERIIYFNMMTLMLSVLDEVVDGMSISFAGHNVRLQLTYLDVDSGEALSPAVTAKTAALVKSAMAPVQQ